MVLDSHEEYKLKQLVRNLGKRTGRHTELVTVYVPAGYNMDNIIGQLSEEQGTASNIKSKTTKKNVVDALEKAIQSLRIVGRTPANGLALFCGNVSEQEGVQDLKVWTIEPPEPLAIKLYRCDKEFILGPLEDMISHKDVYGLVTMDNKNATLATLKGNRYNILKSTASGYSGKHRAGGQSAARFQRLMKEQSHNFKKRVGEYMTEIFLPVITDLRGIVIGGPAGTKNDFIDGDFINHELKKKILVVKDTTYTDESGIRELIDAAKDDLSDVEIIRHREVMQKVLKALVGEGNVAYGPSLQKALDAGAIDTLILSENLPEEEIDQLYEKVKAQGGKIEIMNDEFEEGMQLWKTFKGKVALLRFKIE